MVELEDLHLPWKIGENIDPVIGQRANPACDTNPKSLEGAQRREKGGKGYIGFQLRLELTQSPIGHP